MTQTKKAPPCRFGAYQRGIWDAQEIITDLTGMRLLNRTMSQWEPTMNDGLREYRCGVIAHTYGVSLQ
jgi:hypothetical protein